MVKDYKSSNTKSGGGGRMMHPFSIGIIIGFVLGMGVAFGFAIYLNRTNSPFVEKELPAGRKELKPMESAKGSHPPKSAEGAPKFDFYDILPGKQEAMPTKPSDAADAKERVFLQAGAFQNSADADNLKARLALAGFEAQIKTAHLPDNKTWHRVRLGPFENTEEAQRVMSTLKDNQIQANLIHSKE